MCGLVRRPFHLGQPFRNIRGGSPRTGFGEGFYLWDSRGRSLLERGLGSVGPERPRCDREIPERTVVGHVCNLRMPHQRGDLCADGGWGLSEGLPRHGAGGSPCEWRAGSPHGHGAIGSVEGPRVRGLDPLGDDVLRVGRFPSVPPPGAPSGSA